ncbi:hypothetical protein DFJ73DRAFT_843633 [Zopfochytrium polystomum]|nr:hypothetical protein DFJ73DRAFT_843633 [Zopfochytrium polystomum]
MPPNPQHHHHRSSLKQNNKAFKSRHASKGSIKAKNKGRVEKSPKATSISNSLSSKKADRRNAAKIEQAKKRSELASNIRLFTGPNAPPKVVAVVPLCPDVDPLQVVVDLHTCLELSCQSQPVGPVTLSVERFKQKLKIVPVSRRLMDILDAVRVSDFVILLMSAAVEVDAEGTLALTAIKAQGVPLLHGVVQHLENDSPKMQAAVRKSLLSYMEAHFPGSDSKLFSTSQTQEAISLLRSITSIRPKPVVWRDQHSYVVSDALEFQETDGESGIGILKVMGHVRGQSLSANRLIHIQGFGDYQIQKITSCPIVRGNGEVVDPVDLQFPHPELQDSLVAENEPDPMDGEQTWPTDEEIAEGDANVARIEQLRAERKKKLLRVPKGTSAYQAAWIVDEAENGDEGEDSSGENGDDFDMDDGEDEGESDEERAGSGEEAEDQSEEEYEEIEPESKLDDFDVGFNVADDERQYKEYLAEKKKRKEEEDDLQFPDEVDTPREIPARVRFARYRGLKSFRTSPWDPYENLPLDYARIFQFENYKRTRSKVLKDLALGEDQWEGVDVGRKVIVWITNVPKAVMETHNPRLPFTIFSLLPHERKFTLASCNIHRVDHTNAQSARTIRSKDPLILWSGFRKFEVRPTFSETKGGSNGVFRFERYFHPNKNVLANFYGPIAFMNEPVLVFRASEMEEVPTLVATGHSVPPSPLRIVAKRILLTGHPFKIHRRSAVIRYMFFDPQDVEYFKPIQLHTKMGLTGHIRESLGTHGYMKCLFGEQIKPQDTVCLSLYKRVFPKWNTQTWVDDGAGRSGWAAASGKDGDGEWPVERALTGEAGGASASAMMTD